MTDRFTTTVIINSGLNEVWTKLTVPDLMAEWMGEAEMEIEINTDWKIDSPIFIRGFHHVKFENKGIVLQYEKEKKLKYSHLSSMSRLPDKPANYSTIEFILTPIQKHTRLILNIENFPTEIIRKHLEFYWRTTIVTIKKSVEEQVARN